MTKLMKLSAIAVSAGLFSAPAIAAPTSGECVTYSVQVCITYDSLGYSSLKDCRLTEYARCMAGEPPADIYAYKIEPAHTGRQVRAA